MVKQLRCRDIFVTGKENGYTAGLRLRGTKFVAYNRNFMSLSYKF